MAAVVALIALPVSPPQPCTRCGTVRPRANLTVTGFELVCPECLFAHHERTLGAPTFSLHPPEAPWAGLFARLFTGCDGVVELRAFAGKGRPPVGRLFCAPADDAAIGAFAARHRDHDVYFGVAVRRDATGGTLQHCTCLGALFVDVDFKVTEEAEARARLARCRPAPSAIVHSGGGLHAYWRLREPLQLPDDAEIAKRQLRQLARALGGDLSAAEPARVLRLPGSANTKPEYGAPRRVRVERLA